jgi:maltooligosyltrehalose trehalohydrolase
MTRTEGGYFQIQLDDIHPGSRYLYRINGEKERPDPASRFQPLGVHGPSEVVDPAFDWNDVTWFGQPLRSYIIYELHVGTLTEEGNFEAIIGLLDDLKDLGVNAIELMPVAQFPGGRNWGYDGVYPYAVQDSYGGPAGLKRLVDACHRKGLAVLLDVVYNHLGPEGNYLAEFAPYFTTRYQTPWGPAVNFDGPDSMEVRRFFIENALYWITDFHVDALRLDAVHAICDFSARAFLEQLTVAVHERADTLNRRAYLIAESNQNDVRLLRPKELGGYGLDALWNDDFHHSLHALLTGERAGYYQDFGEFGQVVKAFREGFVYSGEFSSYRRRPHGSSSRDLPGSRLVVCAQNHDQIGNRMLGERLSSLVTFEELKLMAGAVLLSPYVPLLFMGEEYGETAPFQYFVSHLDEGLVEAVRKGRREEFAAFHWQGELPDPQSAATFLSCKLDHNLARAGKHRILLEFHRELIKLRGSCPSLILQCREETEVLAHEEGEVLYLRRWAAGEETIVLFGLGRKTTKVAFPFPPRRWKKLLDSSEQRWGGPGSSVPAELVSSGIVRVPVDARAFAFFVKCE